MALTFTAIVPGDGSQLSKNGTMAFTLSTDVRDAEGVMVSVYVVSTDTEEMAWDGAQFVGRYATLSVKTGDDFIVRRRGGWPTGGVSLRVRELGSTEVMTIWTDGSGAPSDAVGVDGDYYLRTSNGAVYKKAAGTYGSPIFTPVSPTTAAPTTGIGAGNTEGVAATYAKSDHDHKLRTGSTDLTIGTLSDGHLVARSGTTLATVTTTAAGLALLDDADASAQRTTLGLGSLATLSTVPASGAPYSTHDELLSILTADYSLNGGTPLAGSPMVLFPAAQDTFTLAASTTYWVDARWEITHSSGTGAAHSLDFNSGTVTFTDVHMWIEAFVGTIADNTSMSAPTKHVTRLTQASLTQFISTSSNLNREIRICGVFRTNGAGTFIPRIQFGTWASGTFNLKKGSFLRLKPLGASNVTVVGSVA